MRAGPLKYKVVIYERTDTRDSDLGSYKETYSIFLTTRADVRFMSGAEVIQNEALTNTAVVRFIIRYREGIDETMEVEFDGDRYNIKVIEPGYNKVMLTLTCTKIIN